MDILNSSDKAIQSIPINNVKIIDNFWAPRIKVNHEITIPYLFQQCEKTGRIGNFSRAAGLLNDGKRPIFPFDDSDVYKVIEGAAYSLMINPDPKLEEFVDNIIIKIAAGQEDDGYIYTTRTINPDKPHIWAGKKRWESVSILSHELYNMGHLIEAAIGYYLATGKKKLLNMAIKCADLIENDFGPGKIERIPGHQEIEIALVRLFKITSDYKYLKLAKHFLDIRGSIDVLENPDYLTQLKIDNPKLQETSALEYNQSHKKIIEQDEAVGHAVRATYMYSAVTDIATLFKDSEYGSAINQIWNNVVSRKMYITGGIGSRSHEFGESFWDEYQLPNFKAYNETCAAIGNIFWNHRLFLLYGDAKYIDILERTLYNGFLSGISIEGNKFYYTNPLASKGNVSRRSWYKCPCCPTNIVRFIPQIPSYIYALENDCIFVNLFIGSIASIDLQDVKVKLIQETNFPWEEKVKITVSLTQMKEFTIAIRIPGWAQNMPVPSDLYRYFPPTNLAVRLNVNNELVEFQIDTGFARIQRLWNDNDVIEIDIPMPIRRVLSNPMVKENIDKVAIERGPIVYCIESIDNNDESIFSAKLNDNDILQEKYKSDLLNGIVTITGPIYNNDIHLEKIHFIPYYTWANRGKSQMTIWIQRDSANSN
ncbi:MAG: glycoside hydrolase family 127 protein [Candidatus Lokiarchaeota archaeon]|nr:glycoside hydrolase family 127 protein [Candidatus Lokiarchaeota archaeon]